MKTKVLYTLLVSLATTGLVWAQPGMQFEHGLTWAQVKEKAKKENKYIFVDAFTTWCGPCKQMAKAIFPLPEVGAFYNANFINLKVQLDSTTRDDAEVKKWYADARKIQQQYQVKVFPTYLFLNPDGQLVHRAVGSSPAAEFITKGKNALDPTKQYYTLKARYDAGDRNPELLRNIALAAMEAYDNDKLPEYGQAYFATQSSLLTPENVKLLQQFTTASTDTGFALMMSHPEAFDAVLGANYAVKTTRMILLQEYVVPELRKGPPYAWADMEKQITSKYPQRGDVVGYAQLLIMQQTGNWDEFGPAAVAFMRSYQHTMNNDDRNAFAWAVFEHCADMNCIEEAILWSKQAALATQDATYYDTYANLVYKSGKRDDAIKLQEQTVALAKAAGSDDVDSFEATLQKMRKGEKTW